MEHVLVTGGSGYIAGFIIEQLLREGVPVRATLRSLSREAEVRAQFGTIPAASERLSFVTADLDRDDGWADAMAGITHVLHVASPIPAVNPRDETALIRPARDGALRVLRAARDAGVARAVMTASTACISYGRGSYETPATEADWTDATNYADTSAYERSKTIAERAARDFCKTEGGSLEFVTVNPSAVLGPLLGRDFSPSLEIVKKLMDGSIPAIPHFGYPIVDVRDLATLHLLAMRAPGIDGERFIGGGEFWWMADVARTLHARLGKRARRVPKYAFPSALVRLVAMFDPLIRGRLFELDKHRPVSSAHAIATLGWSPRGNAETIVDTAESLLAAGIVAA